MVSTKTKLTKTLAFERRAARGVYVPNLSHLAEMVRTHLTCVVGIEIMYALAGKGDSNPTLRVTVGTHEETDPPGHLSEVRQRSRWEAFENACDHHLRRITGDSSLIPVP